MFCQNCGKENPSGSIFCENCGSVIGSNPIESNVEQPITENVNNNVSSSDAKTNTLAIVGFILSLVGIFCFGILFGAAGIVLGIIARGQIKSNPGRKGSGLALAGIIIGSFDVVFVIFAIVMSVVTLTIM